MSDTSAAPLSLKHDNPVLEDGWLGQSIPSLWVAAHCAQIVLPPGLGVAVERVVEQTGFQTFDC